MKTHRHESRWTRMHEDRTGQRKRCFCLWKKKSQPGEWLEVDVKECSGHGVNQNSGSLTRSTRGAARWRLVASTIEHGWRNRITRFSAEEPLSGWINDPVGPSVYPAPAWEHRLGLAAVRSKPLGWSHRVSWRNCRLLQDGGGGPGSGSFGLLLLRHHPWKQQPTDCLVTCSDRLQV